MFPRIALVGLVAMGMGACATETRTVVVAEDVCSTAYGFRVSSPEYRLCRDREAAARRAGRMSPSYGEAPLVADSQAACQSYGLHPHSHRYQRSVPAEPD